MHMQLDQKQQHKQQHKILFLLFVYVTWDAMNVFVYNL